MKIPANVLAALLLTASLTATGLAAEVEKPREPRLRGEVSAIDTKAGSVKVKSRSGEKTVVFAAKTKAGLDKIKIGDRVRITYVEKDGKLLGQTIGEARRGRSEDGAPNRSTGPGAREAVKPAK
jgi:Cu/Ag efflux protein CusF